MFGRLLRFIRGRNKSRCCGLHIGGFQRCSSHCRVAIPQCNMRIMPQRTRPRADIGGKASAPRCVLILIPYLVQRVGSLQSETHKRPRYTYGDDLERDRRSAKVGPFFDSQGPKLSELVRSLLLGLAALTTPPNKPAVIDRPKMAQFDLVTSRMVFLSILNTSRQLH